MANSIGGMMVMRMIEELKKSLKNEIHYRFYDGETGEDFIVGAYDIGEAYDVARDSFAFPVYTGVILTEEEAEASGWDEY